MIARTIPFALLSFAATLLNPSALHAATSTFTNLSAWQSAAQNTPSYSSTLVETFESSPLGYFQGSNLTPTHLPIEPVLFLGFDLSGNTEGEAIGIVNGNVAANPDISVAPPFAGQHFLGWGMTVNNDGNLAPTLTFTFSSPTYAFGFDWMNTDFTDSYSLTLSTGEIFSSPPLGAYPNEGPMDGFFGVVSDVAITSFTIKTANFGGVVSTAGVDNIRTVQSVPEPSTCLLAGAAFTLLLFKRRRVG
jgi:hypothetical protein